MLKQEIINACKEQGFIKAQIAYVLATVKHETNDTFRPVTEAYWLDDPDAYLKKHHADYYPYYGRGLVQITWKKNYAKFGKLLGIDLVARPSLALVNKTAIDILVLGFRDGLFTGKKLSMYVNPLVTDFLGARRCINGIDKAALIAKYADAYMKEL